MKSWCEEKCQKETSSLDVVFSGCNTRTLYELVKAVWVAQERNRENLSKNIDVNWWVWVMDGLSVAQGEHHSASLKTCSWGNSVKENLPLMDLLVTLTTTERYENGKCHVCLASAWTTHCLLWEWLLEVSFFFLWDLCFISIVTFAFLSSSDQFCDRKGNVRISTESFRLEKSFKIVKSKH